MRVLRRLSSMQIAALVALAVVVVAMVANGNAMFSAGPLNAQRREGVSLGGVSSHSQLDKNCSACHAPPWSRDTMADRCMNCHADVREQLNAHGPLHGTMSDGMQCRTCHTEHKGAHAALTSLDRFDHDCAAFKLTGQHQSVDCKSCHVNNTYKGTAQTCVSCHNEPPTHLGKFGIDCMGCHSTANWQTSTTTLVKFDHDRAAFKLTGKHQTVDCKSCHAKNVFKGTPQSCVSCHSEPAVPQVHKSRYGTNCTQCHKTTGWTGATFEHKAFSITHGKRKNTCATCHNDSEHFKTYTCYNCHEHTPAKIELRHKNRKLADLDNCVKCHGPNRRRERVAVDDVPVFAFTSTCPAAHDDFALTSSRAGGRFALWDDLERREATPVRPAPEPSAVWPVSLGTSEQNLTAFSPFELPGWNPATRNHTLSPFLKEYGRVR